MGISIRNNQRGTLANEPLALSYDYGENSEEPNTFHFQERFKGEAGLLAHQAAPHFKAWEDFVGEWNPFSKPPVIHKFVMTPQLRARRRKPR